jgi:methionyl-tRNA formyltransferase
MSHRLRVAFAGTPTFAARSLEALLRAGFEIPLVLTQPDRPAGRGMKLQPSEVKQVALAHGLTVAQPAGLRLDGRHAEAAAATRNLLEQVRPDVMVVAAYGLILPPWVLRAPPWGCINVHASLLPRWRGAAPIHRAIEAGDTETGVTIMQMDEGLDTGDMLLVERMPILSSDTTGRLHDRLADLGGRLLVEALEMRACGGLSATPQPAEGITYAHKIDKSEAMIDWSRPVVEIERRIRAWDPFPGAVTTCGPDLLKVWSAQCEAGSTIESAAPGTVLSVGREGVRVQTGDGVLWLTQLQRAGGKRLPVAEFLAGYEWPLGVSLGSQKVVG